MEQHARYIESCDGSVREQLREWLDAISAAQRWTGTGDNLVIEMVGYLSKGSLRTSIADYVDQQGQVVRGNGATWAGVRNHITANFLDEDEAEHMRRKADSVKQAPYQDSREYGLKYTNAINKAYTQAQLAVPLVLERVIDNFINGLRDKEVRTQVHLARPNTLQAAVTRANDVARALARGEVERVEEPMEIGALPQAATKKIAEHKNELLTVVKDMSGSMRGLQKQIGRIEKRMYQLEDNPKQQYGNNQHKYE